jgi:hypothetical protein
MENSFLGIGSRVKHPDFGVGVIIQNATEEYQIIFIEHGWRKISRFYKGLEVIDAMEPDQDIVSLESVERILIKLLRKFSDIQETVEMGEKWIGGKIILEPGKQDLSNKEIPIDAFFHKIVMVRDRLRVMEQRINSSKLSDEEKVNLQQYITRIYGSLTTFNVLFKYKSDFFIGEKG